MPRDSLPITHKLLTSLLNVGIIRASISGTPCSPALWLIARQSRPMINIRQQTIDLPVNGLDILTLIRLDTTDFRWLFGNSYFFYYDKIDKPWFGKLSIKDRGFEIRRNGLGLFIDKISAIIVEGTLTEDKGIYKLNVRYNLSLFRTMSFIGLLLLLLSSPFTDEGLAGILAPILLLILLTLLTIRDFKRTYKKFNEFIERVQSNEPQQRL